MVTPLTPQAEERFKKAKRYLRLFLRDTPQLNRLIRKEESDDELLTMYIELAISDWNSTTPLIRTVDIGNYPSLFLLLHGATIQALKSQGILQTRNQLQYSAGGSSFIRSDKGPMYMQWLINFSNDYELKKRNFKIQCNINGGWGGAHSEYDRIGLAW